MITTKPTHHKIISLQVTGGFLKGIKLDFTDGLNCVIGGRGTDKTTVLEFILDVLGLVSNSRKSSDMARSIGRLVQGNLHHGRIQLTVKTKHGMRYVAEPPWNDSCQVFNEKGECIAFCWVGDTGNAEFKPWDEKSAN